MEFKDLQLLVSPRDGATFSLHLGGPGGVANATDSARFEVHRDDYQRALDKVASGEATQAEVEALGDLLYAALLKTGRGAAKILLERLLEATRGPGRGARLRLVLPAGLGPVPWEYLRDGGFLVDRPDTCLVRHLDVPLLYGAEPVALPIRILGLAPPMGDIDVVREGERVRAACEQLGGAVALTWIGEGCTRARVEAELRTFRPHIIHFAGHGRFTGDSGEIRLEDDGGVEVWLGETELADLVAPLTEGADGLRLVVLTSCETGSTSDADAFAGVATSLVEAGVAAAVSMQFRVRDSVATTFSDVFYRSLLVGDDRGRVDVAITAARVALAGGTQPSARGIPVLHARIPPGVIFDPADTRPFLRTILSQGEIHRQSALVEAADADLGRLAPGDTATRGRLSAQRSRWRREIFARRLARVLAAVAGVGALLAAWTGAWNLVGAEGWSHAATVSTWQAVFFPEEAVPPVPEDLLLLEISCAEWSRGPCPPRTERVPPAWRREVGRIVTLLAREGAREVVLTTKYTSRTDPEVDAALTDGIGRAVAAGTKVLLPFETLCGQGGDACGLGDCAGACVLPGQVASGFGAACVADEIERDAPLLLSSAAYVEPGGLAWPSLPVAAWLAEHGVVRKAPLPVESPGPDLQLAGLPLSVPTWAQGHRKVQGGAAGCFADGPEGSVLRSALPWGARFPDANRVQLSDIEEPPGAGPRGATVYVHFQREEPVAGHLSDAERMVLTHAALRTGRLVQVPGGLELAALTVLLAGAGAATALWRRARTLRREVAALSLVFVGYVFASGAAWATARLILDPLSGLTALLLPYLAARWARRRFR